MNLSDLSDMQLDAIREICGIGAGHAATALSELVGRLSACAGAVVPEVGQYGGDRGSAQSRALLRP